MFELFLKPIKVKPATELSSNLRSKERRLENRVWRRGELGWEMDLVIDFLRQVHVEARQIDLFLATILHINKTYVSMSSASHAVSAGQVCSTYSHSHPPE